MVDRRNATPSWSGYNHQGKVGIFLALKELGPLIKAKEEFSGYKLELEKNGGEDIEISNFASVVSRHQVKAYKEGKYPNNYANVRKINSDTCPKGYQTAGTTNQNRFLHVICEVFGWEIDSEKEFKELYGSAKYVPNESEVKLYKYPNDKYYCDLIDGKQAPIDGFCKTEIKNILTCLTHHLKDDEEHIEETLLEIKELVSKRISGAHKTGRGAYPEITFKEIEKMIISTEKRERQSIRRVKTLFEIYWNKNFDDTVNEDLFCNILNLSPEEFEQFIIDLHPQKSIESLKETQLIDALLDEDVFEEIFYEFYKQMNQEHFDITEVRYASAQSTYRLSLINKKHKHGEVSRLVQNIIKNRQFLKASFDVDYLVNGNINAPIFDQKQTDEVSDWGSPYPYKLSKKDDIFANNLELIDIDKTVEKLKGEGYE